MKKIFTSLAVICIACTAMNSCKKQETAAAPEAISRKPSARIKALGFGTGNVQKTDGGYIVEGDILLTPEHLKSKPITQFLRVGEEEQYRTATRCLAFQGPSTSGFPRRCLTSM